MLWHEKTPPADDKGAETEAPKIVALVDVGGKGKEEIARTLLSLANEGVAALKVDVGEIATFSEASLQVDWQDRPWLMPLVAGDILANGAADAYRVAISATEASVVYADDDLLGRSQRRASPHFKPDWNSELFRHFDYLTGACALRVSSEELLSFAGMEDWAARLVALSVAKSEPVHLRQVLHHRRSRPISKIQAVAPVPNTDWPLVTIIVPTRDRVDLLRTCLNGVAATDYPNLEVIIVDNDSKNQETIDYFSGLDPARHRVIRYTGAFNFSAMNNRAAEVAKGRVLCLLNNDIEVIDPSWLALMVVQAMREDVGAVGAQLLYPDKRIQHAGVVMGMGNAAGHAHRFLYPDEEGYFRRHALPQFVSAVTAACLVVSRERFLAVGGLDEFNFRVAFNDVDFCLRLNQRGWQSLYEPRARLIHHESVSRGFDHDPVGARRFAGELAALQRLWGTEQRIDPYHHPELSRASEKFVVRL